MLVAEGLRARPVIRVAAPVRPLSFRQLVAASDALRTGTYGKTLTFTLSTTNP